MSEGKQEGTFNEYWAKNAMDTKVWEVFEKGNLYAVAQWGWNAARQANQPQEKAQPEMEVTYLRFKEYPDCMHHSDGYICGPCTRRSVGEMLQAAFQRGQQAMAEKAAQLREVLEALVEHAPESCGDSDCDCLHYKTALSDARSVLAAEPPQGEAESERPSNHTSVQRAVTGED
jgi:hypothetical protein